MTQEDVEKVVRLRIRGLRRARGWSLDSLAARCQLSASSLSRIETGRQKIGLDQLVTIAAALGTSLDQLVEPEGDDDVVIRPEPERMDVGVTFWLLSRERDRRGVTVAKMRITEDHVADELRVHPGYEWFTVLSGTLALRLGTRTLRIDAGQAVEFSTMTPHSMSAVGGPVELLMMFDKDGEQAHRGDHARR